MRPCARTLAAIAIALACALVPARAADIPGQDDPAFKAAVELWLGDDEEPALRQLTRLAEGDNTAARFFLHTAQLYTYASSALAHLEPADRRALTEDARRPRTRLGRTWLADIPDPLDPLAQAILGPAPLGDRSAWRAQMDLLIRAEERERMKSRTQRRLNIPGLSDAEVVEIAELIGTDAPEYFDVWFLRTFAEDYVFAHRSMGQTIGPDEAFYLGENPWRPQDEADLRAALDQGAASAAAAAAARAALKKSYQQEVPNYDQDTIRNGLALLDETYFKRVFDRPATLADHTQAGAYLIARAAHEPWLRPLAGACQRTCPGQAALCAVDIVAYVPVNQLVELDTPMESLVSQDRWLGSPRAERALLDWVGQQAKRRHRDGRANNFNSACLRQVVTRAP